MMSESKKSKASGGEAYGGRNNGKCLLYSSSFFNYTVIHLGFLWFLRNLPLSLSLSLKLRLNIISIDYFIS